MVKCSIILGEIWAYKSHFQNTCFFKLSVAEIFENYLRMVACRTISSIACVWEFDNWSYKCQFMEWWSQCRELWNFEVSASMPSWVVMIILGNWWSFKHWAWHIATSQEASTKKLHQLLMLVRMFNVNRNAVFSGSQSLPTLGESPFIWNVGWFLQQLPEACHSFIS